MRQKDIRPAPARIEFKGMKFLITDRPSDLTMHSYILVSFYFYYYFLSRFFYFFYFYFWIKRRKHSMFDL